MPVATDTSAAKQRPPQQVLDLFWQLADVDQTKRVNAIDKVSEVSDHGPYVQRRLLSGLCSGRAASRVGFGAALADFAGTYELDALFEKADECFVTDDSNNQSECLANVFLCAAVLANDKCQQFQDTTHIFAAVNRLWTSQSKCPKLRTACVLSLVTLLHNIEDRRTFKDGVWQVVASDLTTVSNDVFHIDFLWLALEIDIKFGKLTKHLPIIESFNTKSKKLIKLLKQHETDLMNPELQYVHPVCGALLKWAAQQADRLDIKIWTNLFEPITFGSNEPKWLVKGCMLLIGWLRDNNNVQTSGLLSATLLQRCQSALIDRTSAAFVREHVTQLLDVLIKMIVDNTDTLLDNITIIMKHTPAFDRLTKYSLIRTIVRALHGEPARQYVEQICERLSTDDDATDVTQRNVLLLHLQSLYQNNASDEQLRVDVLNHLMTACVRQHVTSNTDISSMASRLHSTLNDCVKCNLNLTTKSGQPLRSGVNIGFVRICVKAVTTGVTQLQNLSKEEPETMQTLTNCVRLLQRVSDCNVMADVDVAFAVVLCCVFIDMITSNRQHTADCVELIQELLACHAQATNSSDSTEFTAEFATDWLDVFVDLLLMLRSRDQQLLRACAPVALYHVRQRLTPAHVQPLLQAVDISNDDILMDEHEPDDNDEQSERKHESDQDSDSESDTDVSEHAPLPDVNVALIKAVKAALGDAALDDDDEKHETSSIASDLSDNTMLRLDDHLANAFRQHATMKSNKDSANVKQDQADEQERAFRNRCCEMLSVLVRADQVPTDVLMSMFGPMLSAADLAVRTKSEHALYNKLTIILSELCQIKVKIAPTDNSIFNLTFDSIVSVGRSIMNPVLQTQAGQCLAAVLRLANRLADPNLYQELLTEKMCSLIAEYFGGDDDDEHDDVRVRIPAPLIQVPIKNHTASLLNCLPSLIKAAFESETVRPYHKAQALSWLDMFVKPNLIDFEHKPMKKYWKSFIKHFEAAFVELLQFVTNPDECPTPARLKPQYVGHMFALLAAMMRCIDAQKLKLLTDATWLKDSLEPLTTPTKWRALPNHKRIVDVVVSLTGKQPYKHCSLALEKLSYLSSNDALEEVKKQKLD